MKQQSDSPINNIQMKKLTILLIFIISIFTIPAFGQASRKAESNGLLYKITRKDMGNPSYMFGTFHIICPADMLPMDKLNSYAEQTDQLLMEVDLDDAAEMQSMAKSLAIPGGKTIKDFMSPEQFAKVDEMFNNIMGYSVEKLITIKPSLLQVIVTTSPKTLGCSTPSSYDMQLMQTAVAGKKPILGLETVDSQGQLLSSKPMEKQVKDLYEMALNPQKSADELKNLIKVYKMQDSEKLFAVSTKLTDDKPFQIRLLDDRNKAWIPKIENSVKEKRTFIAVGAAHLGGKNGVVRLLRAKGYKVEAIRL